MGNASDLHASIGSANDSASEAVGNIPQQVAAQAKGQPLVAGAVAFGLGFLAAAAFPGTPAKGNWPSGSKTWPSRPSINSRSRVKRPCRR